MDAEAVYSQIQLLPSMAGSIRRKEPDAIAYLQRLYKEVTGNTVYAGCKGCHIKAANYLTSLTLENLTTMAQKLFTLKKGISIEWPFRSGQRFSDKNITDAKAAEYLYNNPSGIDHFADYPKSEGGGVDLSSFYPAEVVIEDSPKTKGKKAADPAPDAPETPAE